MNKCPKCHQTTRQHKAGKTAAGSQRYLCTHCQWKYTPEPKRAGLPRSCAQTSCGNVCGWHEPAHGCPVGLRSCRSIAQGTHMPEEVKDAEMDELFTFIGDKKQHLYPYTCRSQNTLLVGLLFGNALKMRSSKWLTKHRTRNAFTRMALMLTPIFSIPSVVMKFPQASPIRIRWKQIMQNLAIIWHAWLASHAVSLAAHGHSVLLYASLPSVTTVENFTNSIPQSIPLTLWIS